MSYLNELEIKQIEILDDTPEEEKLNYYFSILLNNMIQQHNTKLDLKNTKKSLKEEGFQPTELVQAIKYHIEEKENEKLRKVEVIDDYLTKLNEEDNDFLEGHEIITQLQLENEQKKVNKEIKDTIGEIGLNKKAIDKICKDMIDELNPKKKPKEPDIVLEGVIEKYKEATIEIRKKVYNNTDKNGDE